MEKRTLGRTGLEVTQLGFGAMEIRGPKAWNGRELTDAHAEKVLNTVLDSGINFIDTSPDYGISEDYIGKYISSRRDEYYLATKCGCNMIDKGDHYENSHVWKSEHILTNIEASLKRMKTDYVDIWQLHNPTCEDVLKGELIETMEKVRKQGKVRFVSISSTVPHIQTYIEWGKFDTYQIPYSALQREHETIISDTAKSGAGVIVRGGVARGEPGQSGAPNEDAWKKWDSAGLDKLLAQGQSQTDFMLRFTLSHPDMHTTIVGTMDIKHLEANIKSANAGPLSDEVYNKAKDMLSNIE